MALHHQRFVPLRELVVRDGEQLRLRRPAVVRIQLLLIRKGDVRRGFRDASAAQSQSASRVPALGIRWILQGQANVHLARRLRNHGAVLDGGHDGRRHRPGLCSRLCENRRGRRLGAPVLAGLRNAWRALRAPLGACRALRFRRTGFAAGPRVVRDPVFGALPAGTVLKVVRRLGARRRQHRHPDHADGGQAPRIRRAHANGKTPRLRVRRRRNADFDSRFLRWAGEPEQALQPLRLESRFEFRSQPNRLETAILRNVRIERLRGQRNRVSGANRQLLPRRIGNDFRRKVARCRKRRVRRWG